MFLFFNYHLADGGRYFGVGGGFSPVFTEEAVRRTGIGFFTANVPGFHVNLIL